jgi:ATP-binding protein involved in chromosome partitioning
VILGLGGVRSVDLRRVDASGQAAGLRMAAPPRPSAAAAGSADAGLIPEVRHTVAVASGKGGVGKSTVAVNLALALARRGLAVGLLDADVYGPSVPLMMGCQGEQPRLGPSGRTLIPFERWGVHFMSLGFLVDPGSAVIWRGPMVMKALEQLLRDVEWGALDVLLLDMPPGTGDAQLTVSQRIRLAGAVIVTTPQDVALADAVKGVAMFRKVEVPILGIVENMSHFRCPHCSQVTDIFGSGGGRDEARRLGVPLLGEIPLEPAIRSAGDRGEPVVAGAPESASAAAFLELADRLTPLFERG